MVLPSRMVGQRTTTIDLRTPSWSNRKISPLSVLAQADPPSMGRKVPSPPNNTRAERPLRSASVRAKGRSPSKTPAFPSRLTWNPLLRSQPAILRGQVGEYPPSSWPRTRRSTSPALPEGAPGPGMAAVRGVLPRVSPHRIGRHRRHHRRAHRPWVRHRDLWIPAGVRRWRAHARSLPGGEGEEGASTSFVIPQSVPG
jgi:hypothetical protein